jgi:poly(A) polymerase
VRLFDPVNDPRCEFALSVVQTLRSRGFEALWAGGCVRDALMGKSPKDFDVATTALPTDVIRIFGVHRTVAVGASFGVVMVLSSKHRGEQVEVATFRMDGEYLDGRRPVSVQFCRPEEDAKRRDFTINGLFYDPIENRVIDYVEGQQDLQAGVVRAIGDAHARFREDKLRMLRAIRFTATLKFQLDTSTKNAIRNHHQDLGQVSIERVAQELRRMLAHETRAHSLALLEETGLLKEALPEICDKESRTNPLSRKVHAALDDASFELALAALLLPLWNASASKRDSRLIVVRGVCRRLKLSNDESDAICWLLEALPVLRDIATKPLHVVKPLLAHIHSSWLLRLSTAMSTANGQTDPDAAWCREYLTRTPASILNPPALITGHDVRAMGIQAGPAIRELLSQIRNEQLDEKLHDRTQALDHLRGLIEQEPTSPGVSGSP